MPLLHYGPLVTALLDWQPCVNPAILLYFVEPFRAGLLRILGQSANAAFLSKMQAATTATSGSLMQAVTTNQRKSSVAPVPLCRYPTVSKIRSNITFGAYDGMPPTMGQRNSIPNKSCRLSPI
ncbi:unnamed protein product [Gongylonema pulchrum]|uniref:Secreted protein n=1 Tax=Gongylonema pulchrum TaxID=637853 RepID=A0A183EL49_9BILA|nr:unnamed protein product [Gongylonema pulchrum]